MYGFNSKDLVDHGERHRIWQQQDVLGVELAGELSDADSQAWRDALVEHLATPGAPRLLILDTHLAVPRYGVANHLTTTGFLRHLLEHVDWLVLRTNQTVGFFHVSEVVLGKMNLSVFRDAASFAAGAERLRRGLPPMDFPLLMAGGANLAPAAMVH